MNLQSIVIDNVNFVQIKNTHESNFFTKREEYFMVENKSDTNMYVFSTVLSESLMLYSKKNVKKYQRTGYLDSFYPDFMNDSPHSGLREFTFNKIKANGKLRINMNDANFKKLKIYYFLSEKEKSLIDLESLNLQSEIIDLGY